MAINRIIWAIYAKYHFFMYAHPSERVQVLPQTTAMKQTLKQVIQMLWPPTAYRSYVGLCGGSVADSMLPVQGAWLDSCSGSSIPHATT